MANVRQLAEQLKFRVDKAAQQCVKCGLCLPHCPTYSIALNENESPRGRIALMQGAVRGQVPITQKLIYHLDTCLSCRACEAVCPAQVPYAELITSTRAWLNWKKLYQPLWLERAIRFILEHPRLRNSLAKLSSFYPRKYKTIQTVANGIPSRLPHKGRVLLLASCADSIFDQQLIYDAKKVLTKLGWNVTLPKPHYCCGALALQAGALATAQHYAQQQVQQWQEIQPDFIITLTNGCHATLQEYAQAPLNVAVPQIPLLTIEAFLLQELATLPFTLQVPTQRVIVHTPCTLRNALREPHLVLQLLQKFSGIDSISLPTNVSSCCGAAGSYFLRHPAITQELVSPIVQWVAANSATAFVTTNIGCAMHIRRSLKQAGITLPLLHVVSFIAPYL